MSEISTLTIKIPLELKEKIKAAALEKQFSLSTEVCERLEKSFAVDVKSGKSGHKDAKMPNCITTRLITKAWKKFQNSR